MILSALCDILYVEKSTLRGVCICRAVFGAYVYKGRNTAHLYHDRRGQILF